MAEQIRTISATCDYVKAKVRSKKRGELIQVKSECPRYESRHGDVPFLEAAATTGDDAQSISIFAVNRHLSEPLALELRLAGEHRCELVEHLVLSHEDPRAVNDARHPERVVPRPRQGAVVHGSTLRASLAPLSWNVLSLRQHV